MGKDLAKFEKQLTLSSLFSSSWGGGGVGLACHISAVLFARLLYTYGIWARSLGTSLIPNLYPTVPNSSLRSSSPSIQNPS